MPLPNTYTIRLREKKKLTDHVTDFYFDLLEPPQISFNAGQFVLIKTKHPETGELLSRAYSVANPPHENRELHLNIEILPEGKLTSLMDTWEIGKEVEMQGPFGHFTMKSDANRALYFVATGTGVAPFRCMIEDLIERGHKGPMHLLFGLRSENHLFYEEEFRALADRAPNFTYEYCLSKPSENWKGFKGRVTAALEQLELKDSSMTDFYCCGGKPMIDDVRKMLETKGVPTENVRFEQFFL